MSFTLPADSLLVDGIIVALLIFFAVLRGSRGFYDSLLPLVVTLVSVIGAVILALALTEKVTEIVYPWARERLTASMDLGAIRILDLDTITSQLTRLMPEAMSNLLRKLGLELGAFVEEALDGAGVRTTAEAVAEDAVAAVLLPATRSVVRALLFFLSFFVLKLLLTLIGKAAGWAFDLPVVRWFDRLGGAVLGLAGCAIVLYILFWLVDLFSPQLFEALRDSSRILRLVFK